MFTKDFWLTKLKGYERKEERKTKEEEDEKKRYLAFLTFPQQTPQGLRVSFK